MSKNKKTITDKFYDFVEVISISQYLYFIYRLLEINY